MHNGADIFIRYTLSDTTTDTSVNDTDLFGDAIALEIPYSGTGNAPICMGSQTQPVNIIFWRGDLAQPRNIVAGGIGTVQVSPDAASQNIQRYQSWAKSVWTVIVTRPMAASSDNQITFTRGRPTGSPSPTGTGPLPTATDSRESRGGIALRCSNGLRSRNI